MITRHYLLIGGSALRRFLGLLLALFPLVACTPASLTLSPNHPPLQPVAEMAATDHFAWRPDGLAAAFIRGSLRVVDLARGNTEDTGLKGVQSISWGTPGLSAAVSTPQGYRVILLEPHGHEQVIASGAGTVVDQQWREGRLYALVLRNKYYSFGINQRSYLLIWQQGESSRETLLADVTLKPTTPKRVGARFTYGSYLRVSPFGDEIIYSRMHDPPAFSPEYRVFVYHLTAETERQLGRHALGDGTTILLPDGEHALLSDGKVKVERLPIWGEGRRKIYDSPTSELAAAGELIYHAGSLSRGGETLWSLVPGGKVFFSPDAARLAILTQGYLYIADVQGRIPPLKSDPQRLKLRRLRALGLISDQDYRRFITE